MPIVSKIGVAFALDQMPPFSVQILGTTLMWREGGRVWGAAGSEIFIATSMGPLCFCPSSLISKGGSYESKHRSWKYYWSVTRILQAFTIPMIYVLNQPLLLKRGWMDNNIDGPWKLQWKVQNLLLPSPFLPKPLHIILMHECLPYLYYFIAPTSAALSSCCS